MVRSSQWMLVALLPVAVSSFPTLSARGGQSTALQAAPGEGVVPSLLKNLFFGVPSIYDRKLDEHVDPTKIQAHQARNTPQKVPGAVAPDNSSGRLQSLEERIQSLENRRLASQPVEPIAADARAPKPPPFSKPVPNVVNEDNESSEAVQRTLEGLRREIETGYSSDALTPPTSIEKPVMELVQPNISDADMDAYYYASPPQMDAPQLNVQSPAAMEREMVAPKVQQVAPPETAATDVLVAEPKTVAPQARVTTPKPKVTTPPPKVTTTPPAPRGSKRVEEPNFLQNVRDNTKMATPPNPKRSTPTKSVNQAPKLLEQVMKQKAAVAAKKVEDSPTPSPRPQPPQYQDGKSSMMMGGFSVEKYDKMIRSVFPGAVTNNELEIMVIGELQKKGYTPSNTLLATSLCCDELARNLERDFVQFFGKNFYPFYLGGLAGFPFAGNTGFGAMAAHIPDDGSVLIIYGPHVGVTKDGVVGKVERKGIELVDSCCGSAIAASNYLKAITEGGATITTKIQQFTDFQQGAVQELILPHGKRLAEAGKDRMRELPYALYESQDKLLGDIVKNGAKKVKNNIALLGGIQVNTGPDTPDYFVPLRFDFMNNEAEVLEDMLAALR